MRYKNITVVPGRRLYLGSKLYIDHGEDDICGGLAVVERVKVWPPTDPNAKTYFVEFVGIRGGHNLDYILENQKEWRKTYGDRIAHPCPDVPGHKCPNPMLVSKGRIMNVVGQLAKVPKEEC